MWFQCDFPLGGFPTLSSRRKTISECLFAPSSLTARSNPPKGLPPRGSPQRRRRPLNRGSEQISLADIFSLKPPGLFSFWSADFPLHYIVAENTTALSLSTQSSTTSNSPMFSDGGLRLWRVISRHNSIWCLIVDSYWSCFRFIMMVLLIAHFSLVLVPILLSIDRGWLFCSIKYV